MVTVSMFLPHLSGSTDLVMQLRKSSDKSSVNGAGDDMEEVVEVVEAVPINTGWFTATVAETWTETVSVTVTNGDGLVPAGGWLRVGDTIVVDSLSVLSPAYDPAAAAASQASVDAIADTVAATSAEQQAQTEAY